MGEAFVPDNCRTYIFSRNQEIMFSSNNFLFLFFFQWPILNYYIHAVLNVWLCKTNTEGESMLVSYTFWFVLNHIITEKTIIIHDISNFS